jgi:hypothetical protein
VAQQDVEAYLDRLRVLAVENPEVQLIQFKVLETDLFDGDGSDEQLGGGEAGYCEHQGCDKAYPHTHMAGGGGGNLLSGHNAEGSEVFEKNHFLKV